MPIYEELNQCHPERDADKAKRLRALYEGGGAFSALLGEFLPQRTKEPTEQYSLRQRESVYRNYVGPIVDYFTSLLFSSAPSAAPRTSSGELDESPHEYYSQFYEDCDRAGTDLSDAYKAALTGAMVERRAWLWLQHPTVEVEGFSRADFERSGLGDTWIRRLRDDSVLDWGSDDDGNLEWAVIHEIKFLRNAITRGRRIKETWWHLKIDSVDVYSIEYDESKPPSPTNQIALTSSYAHRYGTVPLVCLDLPHSLWVANRLESPQLAHFRLSNMQTWGMSRTCYAMPVFKLDSEEQTAPNMGAGYGIYIGKNESLEWTAPPVDCYGALSDEIKSHKDEIYRIAHTMALGVDNNAAAVGRSAESKQADARATAVVMQAFARAVKESMERLYDMVSAARGDDYKWSIEGLDDFSAEDLPGLVDIFAQVEKFGGIPSPTFNTEMLSRLGESLMPDMSPAQKRTMRDEIEKNVQIVRQLDSAKTEPNDDADANTIGNGQMDQAAQ